MSDINSLVSFSMTSINFGSPAVRTGEGVPQISPTRNQGHNPIHGNGWSPTGPGFRGQTFFQYLQSAQMNSMPAVSGTNSVGGALDCFRRNIAGLLEDVEARINTCMGHFNRTARMTFDLYQVAGSPDLTVRNAEHSADVLQRAVSGDSRIGSGIRQMTIQCTVLNLCSGGTLPAPGTERGMNELLERVAAALEKMSAGFSVLFRDGRGEVQNLAETQLDRLIALLTGKKDKDETAAEEPQTPGSEGAAAFFNEVT